MKRFGVLGIECGEVGKFVGKMVWPKQQDEKQLEGSFVSHYKGKGLSFCLMLPTIDTFIAFG